MLFASGFHTRTQPYKEPQKSSSKGSLKGLLKKTKTKNDLQEKLGETQDGPARNPFDSNVVNLGTTIFFWGGCGAFGFLGFGIDGFCFRALVEVLFKGHTVEFIF